MDGQGLRSTPMSLLAICIWMGSNSVAFSASEQTQTIPAQEEAVSQTFRAPDWAGAVNVTDGGCNASMGEYTLWVYATATICGVPREQADRVVVIRQPLPGVAPIRASTQLSGGTYTVWVYGAGDAGQLRLCAKICIVGNLPSTPAWAYLGEIELREHQSLILRTWQQPEGRTMQVQAMVLSASGAKPDWTP